jgi:ubiquinone biosynthesis protein
LFIGASIIAPYGGDYEVLGVPFFSFFGFAGAFVLSAWVVIDIWRYG